MEKRENARILEESVAEATQQGEHKKAVETARAFLSLGVATVEQIAQATGLPLEEVQSLNKCV